MLLAYLLACTAFGWKSVLLVGPTVGFRTVLVTENSTEMRRHKLKRPTSTTPALHSRDRVESHPRQWPRGIETQRQHTTLCVFVLLTWGWRTKKASCTTTCLLVVAGEIAEVGHHRAATDAPPAPPPNVNAQRRRQTSGRTSKWCQRRREKERKTRTWRGGNGRRRDGAWPRPRR